MVTSRSGGVDDIMKKRKKRTLTSYILYYLILLQVCISFIILKYKQKNILKKHLMMINCNCSHFKSYYCAMFTKVF